MRKFNQTERLAFQQRYATAPSSGTKVWRLYYPGRPQPLYESENYAYCVAEKKRLLANGIGFKEELFKIR